MAGNAATADSSKSRCDKKHLYDVKTEKKYCCQRVLYGVKRNIAANEAHFWDCYRNVDSINYLYNRCAWIKKGLWQPEEDFFFVGFFFSSSSGTLRSMITKRHGHLCPTRVTGWSGKILITSSGFPLW